MLGYTVGGATDILSRLVTQPLAERLGQPFVIETRPGAGTNLATEYVARATPDGYTLLLVGAPNAINASLYSNLKFDFIRDIAPVAGLERLWSLYLAKNHIKDIGPIAKLGRLSTLELTDNQIESLAPLEKLTELNLVLLERNKITDLKAVIKVKEGMILKVGKKKQYFRLHPK